ncbi:uncharacterized protein UTRI_01753 [Ustilago trichophora]|uniref:Uncharacterized protein n=1 Tax=Ustilago trichophora TaxID=86804 RepID=A0A5C3DXX2_9BASI|nr:uncharacterized protein UTRI_01753 [Ustilago trichophora]
MGLRPIACLCSVSIYGLTLTRRAAVRLDVATCCISLCPSALGGTRGEPPTSFPPSSTRPSYLPPSVLLAIPDGDKPLAIPPPCVIGRTSPVRPWWRLFALSAYGSPDDSPQMQPSFGKRGRKDTSSARETWSQAFITSNNAALQAKVRIEEERTKREALCLQHQREERESQERAREAKKERDQRSREAERNFSLEMMRLVVTGKGFQLPILNDNNDSTTGAAFSLGCPAA